MEHDDIVRTRLEGGPHAGRRATRRADVSPSMFSLLSAVVILVHHFVAAVSQYRLSYKWPTRLYLAIQPHSASQESCRWIQNSIKHQSATQVNHLYPSTKLARPSCSCIHAQSCCTTAMTSYQEVYDRYAAAGQEHVLKFYDSLSSDEQSNLLQQLASIDPEHVNQVYKLSISADAEARTAGAGTAAVEPPPLGSVSNPYDNPNKAAEWRQRGLEAISEGKVGIILLAGGQGTRLGSSEPKGCYDIGLPSGKSLFQLQAERIAKLQTLAKGTLPWYIMTSGPTRKATEAFFEKNSYFGLDKENVVFFNQGTLTLAMGIC